MKSGLAFLLGFAMTMLVYVGTARADGMSCSQIRSYVSQYGAPFVLSMARSRGVPEITIRKFRRQCGV